MFFPGEVKLRRHRRVQRTEYELSSFRIDQSRDCQRAAHACFNHNDCIVDEVMRGNDLQTGKIMAEPTGQLVGMQSLP